ncbi:sensor histidine kinase [Nocardioides cynanchi]|uniref:sensor histidine kinase n=1 Tax=Nocardioides cynanchi TaxID=2558918 RepID=UPI00177B59D2|nr:ATP-binding protein [Nocardioides cynanchi]
MTARRSRSTPRPVPPGLAALTLSAPVLAVVLVVLGPPSDISTLLVATWLLAQLGVVVWTARRLRPSSASEQSPVAPPVHDEDLDPMLIKAHDARDRLHEVRATVAGIGLTHRLLSNPDVQLSTAERSSLEVLYDREITRLERILRDEDTAPAVDEPVDVGSVIEPLVQTLRLRGHRVAWEAAEVTAIGRGDDIAEIVHILLENAARHAPGAEVSVQVKSRPSEILLTVSDDGPGVPRDLAPRLFDRGVRGSESPGEGIGLDIARRLARQMGGDLFLDPPADRRGATFTTVLRPSAASTPCLAART